MARGLGVLALVLATAAAVAHAQDGPPVPTLTPLVEGPVRAGETVRAVLQVSLPENFHIQSNKPRDPLLIPTVLTVNPPAGVTVTEVVFPPATDLVQVGQTEPLAVFEQNFSIGVRFAVAEGTPPGELSIPARLRYQACDANMCYIPSTAEIRWTLRVGPDAGTDAGADRTIFDRIPFGQGERPADAAPPAAARPEAETPAASGDGLRQLDGFTVLSATGGYLGSDEFIGFIQRAESGVAETGWFEGRGPLAILLIVFLGGLALNLTPCVFPMIPVNLAIIGAGNQAGSRGRGFLLGGAYGAAMALVYGVLGLVVILTAGSFGTINASPWFNLAIAIVFVALALAMFDVFAIDFSSLGSRLTLGRAGRGSFLLAFAMGAVAALLAGACVAPVVIQVVLFSSDLYAKGTAAALALPFVLGVGMAVPWPLAGAGLASLPKPGLWMVRVKQAFGVLILAMAAYYGYQAYGLFANRWVDATEVTSSAEKQIKAGWHASLADGLATASREGKPVLIDMWATWCKNCLTMDKTTLANENVKAALAGYVKIKLQAEDPDSEPTRTIMRRFRAVGLPTYVILSPQS